MSERWRRLRAIVKADLLIRFRRLSTLVVFLLLNLLAYLSVPDPASGNALLVVEDGRRALYNSAAIGMATAMLATVFIGLVGFYVTSNAIARDVASRCGFVIASTAMRGGEYLLAKLVGNVVFLATFTAGFMLTSMGMLIVRNEAALEPWRFVQQYLLLVPPAIILAAVLAIVFEAIPFLSGRAGDVLYFFLWLACLSLVTVLVATGVDPGPARYFDFAGLGFVAEQMMPTMKEANLSIGGSFDPAKPLFVFQGLIVDRSWIWPRIGSLLIPLPLLGIALLLFHRFDPALVRGGADRARRGWIRRLNAAFKPLGRVLPFLGRSSALPTSLLSAASADARMTFAAHPMLLLFPLGLAIATVASPAAGFLSGVMPVAFGVVGMVIADVPCRDRRAGTMRLLHSVPHLKMGFIGWKLLATLGVAMALLIVPIARVALGHPMSLVALSIGLFAVTAVATSLGVISTTPKAFTLVFLVFWYMLTNDNGASPALDFAGFYGKTTPRVMLAYAAIALVSLAVAQIVHTARLRREN
jgi:hypothetical protein